MKHHRPGRAALGCALALTLAPFAAAAETELQAVTVTATRGGSTAGETPQKITVITREQLEEQLALTSDPAQILGNLVPSYSPSRQKMTNSGETFRGRSALVMIDGVPQSTPLRDSSRDGHVIDLSMVERIEIIHGASAEHGLGATGGIINYVTRRPESGTLRQHAGVSVTVPTDYESDGLGYKLDYRLEGRSGDWDYLATASYQTRGLYYDGRGRSIGVDDVQGDTMDSVSHNVMAKLGYWIDDNQNLELLLNRFEMEGNHDYVNVPGDRDAGLPATSRKGDPDGKAAMNRTLNTSLTYRNADFGGNELTAQVYSQRIRARFGGGILGSFQDPAIAPVGTLFDQSQNESDKVGGKLTLTRDGLFDNHLKLTGGLDLLQDDTRQMLVATNREWVPETRFRNYAPFLQAEFRPTARLQLHGGVRREFAELDVGTFRTIASAGGVTVQGGKPEFRETLANAGLVFQATDRVQVFANYSEGFGMPDVGRVLRAISTPGQSVEDFLDLRPIVTENREIGFRLNHGPFDAELSWYQSDSDLGARLELVDGVYQVRRERTEINGFEATGGYRLNKDHRLSLGYAQVRGRSDTDGDGSVDTRLNGANVPPDRLNLRWSALWSPQLSTHVQVSHYFDRKFDDPELEFDGMTLVDLSFGYKLSVGRIVGGVENLFDKQYISYNAQASDKRDDRYFAGRGRTLTVGYQVDF